jgi:hypothetical protein
VRRGRDGIKEEADKIESGVKHSFMVRKYNKRTNERTSKMSYQLLTEPDESNDAVDYVKMVSDGAPWKCVCCSMTEATLYLGKREGVFLWHRYELRCGHQCHERCYRRWCRMEDVVGCPVCGILSRVEGNQFCRVCGSWGHARETCPLLRLRSYPTS